MSNNYYTLLNAFIINGLFELFILILQTYSVFTLFYGTYYWNKVIYNIFDKNLSN